MMGTQNLTISILLTLFLGAIVGCADNPTEPELTEENVRPNRCRRTRFN